MLLQCTLHNAPALKRVLVPLSAASKHATLALSREHGLTLSCTSCTLALRASVPLSWLDVGTGTTEPLCVSLADLGEALGATKAESVSLEVGDDQRLRVSSGTTEMSLPLQELVEEVEGATNLFQPPSRDVLVSVSSSASWNEAVDACCPSSGFDAILLTGRSSLGTLELASGMDQPGAVERRAVIDCQVSADFSVRVSSNALTAAARPPAETRMRLAVCTDAGTMYTVWWASAVKPRAAAGASRKRRKGLERDEPGEAAAPPAVAADGVKVSAVAALIAD